MVVVRVQEGGWHMDVRTRLDMWENKGRWTMADRHGAGFNFWACWVPSPDLSLILKICVGFKYVLKSQTCRWWHGGRILVGRRSGTRNQRMEAVMEAPIPKSGTKDHDDDQTV